VSFESAEQSQLWEGEVEHVDVDCNDGAGEQHSHSGHDRNRYGAEAVKHRWVSTE